MRMAEVCALPEGRWGVRGGDGSGTLCSAPRESERKVRKRMHTVCPLMPFVPALRRGGPNAEQYVSPTGSPGGGVVCMCSLWG